MSKFVEYLKRKSRTLTKEDVLKGLDFIARTFLPLPDYTYAAVFKAIDIVKSVDEKTMVCIADEHSGKATMYHKEFVDELKSQIAAKDEEISKLRSELSKCKDEAYEAKELKRKIGDLLK